MGTCKKREASGTKDFLFENEWNKKYYSYKQVRPIFIEEETEIIVVTVYAYYFNKEVLV
ncbi:MAG: hypothetical protein HQK92_13935 [Nitrospirae bacterium]|nr:hypothetical protein [Nitrospirota bacterium]